MWSLCSLIDRCKQSGGDCCLHLQESRVNCVGKSVKDKVKGGSKFPYIVCIYGITLYKIIILMLTTVKYSSHLYF